VKSFFISLLWGVALTGVIMLVPYDYCMDGPGRVSHSLFISPMCGAWFPVFAFDHSKIPQISTEADSLATCLAWERLHTLSALAFFAGQFTTASHENAA